MIDIRIPIKYKLIKIAIVIDNDIKETMAELDCNKHDIAFTATPTS